MDVSAIKNVKVFYWVSFLGCFRPHWPIAVLYYQSITGSYASAMMLFSIIFLTQSVLEVPTGVLSDLIGRKKSMIAGAVSVCVALVLYAIGLNVWVLIAGAVCEGLGRSISSGTDKAFLYESLHEQNHSKEFETIFGKACSFEQMALGLSALLGGVLSLISLQFVMWVAVIPAVLSLICTFRFVDVAQSESSRQSSYAVFKDAIKGLVRNRRLRLVSTAEVIGFGFGEASFYFQAAFFNMLLPQWLIGVVRSINHFFGAVGFWTAGSVIKRFGHKKVLIGGNIIASLIELIALVFASVLTPFVMAIMNVDYGYSSTAKNGLMQREFSDKQRATMGSMVSMAGSLCFAVVSILLGFIADYSSPLHAMLFALSSNIVVIWIYLVLFAKNKPVDKAM